MSTYPSEDPPEISVCCCWNRTAVTLLLVAGAPPPPPPTPIPRAVPPRRTLGDAVLLLATGKVNRIV